MKGAAFVSHGPRESQLLLRETSGNSPHTAPTRLWRLCCGGYSHNAPGPHIFHTHKETGRYIHTHAHTLTQGVLLKVLGPYFLCAHDIHKYEREHTHTQVCMFLSFVFAADLRGETDDIKNFRFGNGTMFWHSHSIG